MGGFCESKAERVELLNLAEPFHPGDKLMARQSTPSSLPPLLLSVFVCILELNQNVFKVCWRIAVCYKMSPAFAHILVEDFALFPRRKDEKPHIHIPRVNVKSSS